MRPNREMYEELEESDHNREKMRKEIEDSIINGNISSSIETGNILDALGDVKEWIEAHKLSQYSWFYNAIHDLEDISDRIQFVRDIIFEIKGYKDRNIEIRNIRDLEQQRQQWRDDFRNREKEIRYGQISKSKYEYDDMIRIIKERQIIVKWLKKQISKSNNDEFCIRLSEMANIIGMKMKINDDDEGVNPELLYRMFRYALFVVGDFEVNLMLVDDEPLLSIRKARDRYKVIDSLLIKNIH